MYDSNANRKVEAFARMRQVKPIRDYGIILLVCLSYPGEIGRARYFSLDQILV